jgi:hypothetical protein
MRFFHPIGRVRVHDNSLLKHTMLSAHLPNGAFSKLLLAMPLILPQWRPSIDLMRGLSSSRQTNQRHLFNAILLRVSH